MSAAETARRRAEEARAKREAERRAEEQAARWHVRDRARLRKHVTDALAGFAELGLKVGLNSDGSGGGLYKGSKCVAQAWVAWATWEFQGSDESPVTQCSGNQIYWKVEGHWAGEQSSGSAEEFDRGFGEAMARWV